MSPADFQKQEKLKACGDLLALVESGVIDGLQCPDCKTPEVSAWFTQPSAHEYRTWLLCKHCSFELRIVNARQPASFHPDRIDHRLQEYDKRLCSNLRT